jgi:iron complex transport system permease protein
MSTITRPITPTETAAGGSSVAAYRRMSRRRLLLLLALAGLLTFTLAVDIAWGPARLSLPQVLRAIVAPDSVGATTRVIVWEIRGPVALMAVLVGASLAVAGAEMQTILNNPLASPFTLGISAAICLSP